MSTCSEDNHDFAGLLRRTGPGLDLGPIDIRCRRALSLVSPTRAVSAEVQVPLGVFSHGLRKTVCICLPLKSCGAPRDVV